MILEKCEHERTLDRLVRRLSKKYPTHKLLRNMDYKKTYGSRTIGQIDLLRMNPRGGYVVYEVKTGLPKVAHANEQYQRFKKAFPTHDIKGVYVHPEQVQRLR